MRIAVDIDETLGTISHVLEEKFSKKCSDGYHFEGADDAYFDGHPLIYLRAVPYERRASELRKMAREHEVVYVTRRNWNAFPATFLWLLLNRFPIRRIYFTKDKGALAEKIGVEQAIDDSPGDILSYTEHGIPCLVVRKPYNSMLEAENIW